jgi:hypothetical protein
MWSASVTPLAGSRTERAMRGWGSQNAVGVGRRRGWVGLGVAGEVAGRTKP